MTPAVDGRIVVVHATIPASGAPDPRDRQVLRRVLDLASCARTELVLVAAEPQLGTTVWPELAEAGVRVVPAAGRLDAALRAEAGGAALIVATDLWTAERASGAAPTVALVVELAAIRSESMAGARPAADELEVPGFEAVLRSCRERDTAVLEHAALVICTHEAVALAARVLAPEAAVVVSAPPVPLVEIVSPGFARRAGVVFVGSFASAPGIPDERALESLLDGIELPVSAIGIDASVVRRAVRQRLVAAHPPAHIDAALRRCRVAVMAHAAGPVATEIAGMGVPVVALDESDALDRIRRLASDEEFWEIATVTQIGMTRTVHDPVRRGHDVIEALAQIGAPVDASRLAPRWPGAPGFRPHSTAGTLGAVRDSTESARLEAQPPPLIPWEHALYTNLDLAPDVAYRRWLDVHHDVGARRDIHRARAERAAHRPLVSIVMPVHDTDPSMLRAAVESVLSQIYDRWELCIADDATSRSDTLAALDEMVARDERIRCRRLDLGGSDSGGGISRATNAAIELANGSYVAFLDHDDVLTPDALVGVVRLLAREPGLDVVFTDEDKIDLQGRRTEPFCKPDWSPDLLLSCNYITHLLVVRRSLLAEVGGLRPEFDGAQDYDLLLRLTERTDRIGHVAAPLYSWRMSPSSTAADIHAKPEAHAASRRAVEEAVSRRGVDATVEPAFDPTWHRVRRRITHRPLVTVVVPTRDRVDLLAPCLDLIRSTVGRSPVELMVVDNESTDPDTLRYLDRFDGRVVRYPHRFNYARQMNLAAMEATGDVLLLLNNDARPMNDGWFDALLEHVLRPEVGAVGARLRFPSGRAQHEGIVLNAAGVALNLDSGPWAVLGENIRNTAAVTGACMMVRTSVWHAVGGMDERLRVAYNDVDLCLRIGERGWRVIYTPYAELQHAESSSRGSLHPEVDEAFYQQRWGGPRATADPFFTTAIELLTPFSPRL